MLSFLYEKAQEGGKRRKVLNMKEQQTIRLLYESEGKSLREISEITNHDFRTVQKYAYQDDWRPSAEAALQPENYKVLGPYIPIIDGWLESHS